MSSFLLYQKKEKVFPSDVNIGGKTFRINADFRNILRIFAVLKDWRIPEYKRIAKLIQWFFIDFDESANDISYELILKAFSDFVNPQVYGDNDDNSNGDTNWNNDYDDNDNEGLDNIDKRERHFCYDFDAEEIYSGFISEYNMDLVDDDAPNYIRYMHWYKFKTLLGNLSSESTFKKKIELRFMDLNDYILNFDRSAQSAKSLRELVKAKEAVQLPGNYDEVYKIKETEEIEEFNNIWGKVGII